MASKKNNRSQAQTFPFETVEEAWFWFVAAQEARADGARFTAGAGLLPRPCEPLDIMKVVDGLYRQRRLMRDHLLVLRHYGRRRMAPDPRRSKESRAYTLWEEAMMRMESILERKGIIHTNDHNWADNQMPEFIMEGTPAK